MQCKTENVTPKDLSLIVYYVHHPQQSVTQHLIQVPKLTYRLCSFVPYFPKANALF